MRPYLRDRILQMINDFKDRCEEDDVMLKELEDLRFDVIMESDMVDDTQYQRFRSQVATSLMKEIRTVGQLRSEEC